MREITYKGFVIKPSGFLWVIRHNGKGSIPMELRGRYTTKQQATIAIDELKEAPSKSRSKANGSDAAG